MGEKELNWGFTKSEISTIRTALQNELRLLRKEYLDSGKKTKYHQRVDDILGRMDRFMGDYDG